MERKPIEGPGAEPPVGSRDKFSPWWGQGAKAREASDISLIEDKVLQLKFI